MGDEISYSFNKTTGLSKKMTRLTLFGVCIDELEQIIAKFVKEEDNEEVFIENISCLRE